jgi:hypothetical protein
VPVSISNRATCLAVIVAASGAGAGAKGYVISPTIEQVKVMHQKRLLAQPGVISVGIERDAQDESVIVAGRDERCP